ncbi:hypothetical protein [Rickettsia endosymbiont of Proechinophthirus fluctus]|uniref:hypothetical protein n=1 Tax=Rickettsia endosymbiont of Proechinophthirus fluctus TaxID=1462733 RepID=UPI000A54D992|nr:hypothetical protein [Rickettsia endosymbiont of Proechinophthirus fluctus]
MENEEQIARLFKNIILSGHKICKICISKVTRKGRCSKIYIKSALPSNNFEEIQNCTKKNI